MEWHGQTRAKAAEHYGYRPAFHSMSDKLDHDDSFPLPVCNMLVRASHMQIAVVVLTADVALAHRGRVIISSANGMTGSLTVSTGLRISKVCATGFPCGAGAGLIATNSLIHRSSASVKYSTTRFFFSLSGNGFLPMPYYRTNYRTINDTTKL